MKPRIAIILRQFMLLALLVCYTCARAQESHYDSVYYDESGTEIKQKNKAGIAGTGKRKSFVIKTSREPSSFYYLCEMRGDCRIGGQQDAVAGVHGITKRMAKTVKGLIEQGKTSDPVVKENIVEISNIEIFQKIRARIGDSGLGGEDPANCREYGGKVYENDSITLVTGPVADPVKGGAHVDLRGGGKYEYHSHPSGYNGYKPPDPDQILSSASSNAVSAMTSLTTHTEEGTSSVFMQGPSKVDQEGIGNKTGYVFAMRIRVIIIYDSSGIVATLPLEFAEVRKIADNL